MGPQLHFYQTVTTECLQFTSIKSFQCEEFLTIDWQSLQVGVGGSVVEYFRKITDIYGY